MNRELASHEIVTIAVYLLGGEREPVDTEDVAKKANELAPGRFTWRKYKDQIKAESEVGSKVGASGTPTFFINGEKLVGRPPPPIESRLPTARAGTETRGRSTVKMQPTSGRLRA